MSWSAAGMVENVADIEGIPLATFDDDSTETKEQYLAALDLAKRVVREGLVGKKKEGRKFHVAMSGHANAEHEPIAGAPNDQIIVTVRQV